MNIYKLMTEKREFLGGSCQRGAALVVVLVILVAMTIAGLAGMQINSLEERMSANSRDRIIAFQAAEAVLRIGQSVAMKRLGEAKKSCANGLCSQGAAPDPITYDWAAGGSHVTVLRNNSNGIPPFLSADPGYFIERAGLRPDSMCQANNLNVARIVSHAQGIDPKTQVILESYIGIGCI